MNRGQLDRQELPERRFFLLLDGRLRLWGLAAGRGGALLGTPGLLRLAGRALAAVGRLRIHGLAAPQALFTDGLYSDTRPGRRRTLWRRGGLDCGRLGSEVDGAVPGHTRIGSAGHHAGESGDGVRPAP